jgi:hypothetical protein
MPCSSNSCTRTTSRHQRPGSNQMQFGRARSSTWLAFHHEAPGLGISQLSWPLVFAKRFLQASWIRIAAQDLEAADPFLFPKKKTQTTISSLYNTWNPSGSQHLFKSVRLQNRTHRLYTGPLDLHYTLRRFSRVTLGLCCWYRKFHHVRTTLGYSMAFRAQRKINSGPFAKWGFLK